LERGGGVAEKRLTRPAREGAGRCGGGGGMAGSGVAVSGSGGEDDEGDNECRFFFFFFFQWLSLVFTLDTGLVFTQ
jgi:hypothetical protein